MNHKDHGIACAGIIAASNNNLGIRGIASNVNILPVNIVPNPDYYDWEDNYVSGFGTNIEIAQAINWAWRRSDVLSCSWGGSAGNDSEVIIAAIDSARTFGRNGKGSIVVFSSGNGYPNTQDVLFPAYLDGVITVGAIDKNGSIWNYSQRGISMDLVAPSGNINYLGDVRTTDRMGALGSDSGNYMDDFGGTSAACPQVSGVAALMLSIRPDLNEAQVRTILQQTATDMGSSGFDNTYGYGRVNAYSAIQAVYPISGPQVVCNTNSTFTLHNLPSGATCSWSFSGGSLVTPSSGNDTTAIFRGTSCSNPGKGNLVFTVTNGDCSYQVVKPDIIVNGPPYQDVTLSVLNSYGQTIPDQSLLCPYTTYHMYIHNNSSCSTSDYTWEVPSGWSLNYTYNDMASITTNDSPWGNVVVKAQTCCTGCGSNVEIHSAYFGESWDCGMMLSVYPNPAGNYADITIKTDNAENFVTYNEREYLITVTDINGTVKFTGKINELHYRLNTTGFKEGMYIVKLVSGERSWASGFMIKH